MYLHVVCILFAFFSSHLVSSTGILAPLQTIFFTALTPVPSTVPGQRSAQPVLEQLYEELQQSSR